MLTAALGLATAGVAPAQAQMRPPPPAAAASPNGGGKIGVATLGPAGLPADLRIKLEDAAAAGLRASGAEVVSGTELSRARTAAALGACTDAVCEQRLAQITDTRYWLRGNIVLDTSTYRIHLELTDARSGTVLGARDDTCDICTEADAVEAVNVAASALKAKVNPGRPVLAASPPPAAPAPAGPTSTDGAPADGSSGADAGHSGRPTWRRVLPWVAFAGAAAALGAGAYYWSVDGDCRRWDPPTICQDVADRRPEMFISFGIGAALAATGVVLLVVPGSTPAANGDTGAANPGNMTAFARSLGVGFSRRGMALSGRF